ncbi:IDEAL domain protein [compost metagenome]
MFNIYIPKLKAYVPFDTEQLAVCAVYYTEEELDDVIDLALLLKDEQWFKELVKEKEEVKWHG